MTESPGKETSLQLKGVKLRKVLVITLVLLGVMAFAPGAHAQGVSNFSFSGYTYNDTGSVLPQTNATVEVYSFGQQGPSLEGTYSNVSNASGYFNITNIEGNDTYFYKPVITKYNGSTATHINENAPDLPYFEFESLGEVKFYMRDAATINITAFGQEQEVMNIEGGSPNSLPNYSTGLEWMNDTNQWAYVNATGNNGYITILESDFTFNRSVQVPMKNASAIYYNGSGGFYAANASLVGPNSRSYVSWFNTTGSLITTYNVSNRSYTNIAGLEYHVPEGDVNGSFYISADRSSDPWDVIDEWNETFTPGSNETARSNLGSGPIANVADDEHWYMAVNRSGTYELLKYDGEWSGTPVYSWELNQSIDGLAHDGSSWYYASSQTGNVTNITLSDGGVKSFMYQVKDTKLGYPVKESFTSFAEQSTVTVPANRNYSIMMYPNQAMPVSYELTGIKSNSSWQNDNRLNVRFNLTEEFKWVSGTVTTPNGTAGFDDLTAIPYLLEPGNMVFGGQPMPHNMSTWREPWGTLGDQYAPSDGEYNITLIGSAMGADVLLFVTAYNQTEDQHYGGFINLTMTTNGNDLTDQNLTLRPLLGNDDNISVDNAQNFQSENIATAKKSFRLQNSNGSAPNNAFVEVTVDYSDYWSVGEFSWMTDVGQAANGTFSIPAIEADVEEVNIYSSDYAPKETSIDASELSPSNGTVNITLSQFNPGGIEGNDSFGDLYVDLFKSTTKSDIPYPDANYSLTPSTNLAQFNPLTVILGGGQISFRMAKLSNNITVHYVNVDLLASGPPDALFDSNSSDEQTDGTLAQAWRFGSSGPEIYDHVLIGMPYNSTRYPDDKDIQVRISKLYDEDWNVVWNISQNTTADLPERYADYNQGDYKNYIDSSLDPVVASKTDENMTNNIAYVDTDRDMLWMKIPHFSGVAPQISVPSTTTSSSSTDDSSSSDGPSLPSTISGDVKKVYNKYTVITMKPGEPAEVQFTDDAPIRGLRISSKTQVFDPSFSAAEHNAKPDDVDEPGGTVRSYISITTSMMDDEVDSAEIDFSIPRSWLDENGLSPSDVMLSRWHDGAWHDLETKVTSEDGDVTFTATTPGFSVFAIRGATTTSTVATATPTTQPTESGSIATATPEPEQSTVTTQPTEEPETKSPGFTALLAAASIVGAAAVLRRRA